VARVESRPRGINALLTQIFERLAQYDAPLDFDFEKALLELGCGPADREKLVDYIPSVCGRAFLHEMGIVVLPTYSRPEKDGRWGQPQRFSDDPLWVEVETFVATRWTTAGEPRRRFGLAALHSAELGTVNKALNAGKTLASLRGGRVATAFIAPLKFDEPIKRRGRVASLWRRFRHLLSLSEPTRMSTEI
jgi:hypothetical protein